MNNALRFLSGSRDPQGRTVNTILTASDHWLEMSHDWVQWAFPNQGASAFNEDAPVWTEEEARSLSPEARNNLRQLLKRFEKFLQNTTWWRHRSDHNHARITRVILCLRDAEMREEAQRFYDYVCTAPEPGETSRSYWRAAVNFDIPYVAPKRW
jgi:hypothetical protein